MVDVDVGCWKTPVSTYTVSSGRVGFSKHFFTRWVVTCPHPHPHPSIHTPSHPHPSIYAVCKFTNAHKSGKTTVGINMPTLYAHTHIYIWSHLYFDNSCNLQCFLHQKLKDRYGQTALNWLRACTLSLPRFEVGLFEYIFLLMEGRRMQRRHAMPRVVQGLSWRQEPFKGESFHDLQCVLLEWTCWVHELVLADRVCSVGKPCNVSHNTCCKESLIG